MSSYRFVPIGIVYINFSFCAIFIFQTRPSDTVSLLSKISDLLKAIKKGQKGNNFSDEIDEIQSEISQNIGKISAIDSALFDKKDSGSFSIPPISPTYHSVGFYDDNFFNDIILSAKQRIVICCKRNTRPFKQGNIDELIDKAANGVNIQILSFSPTMDDALLEEIRKSVPHPPKDIEELRNTQKNHAKIYQDRKNKMDESLKRNLNYFETSEIIWFNFVLVDNRFYWGIVNYKKTDEDHSVYKNRPYIEYPLTDPFAKKIMKIYEKIISDIGTGI